MKQWLKKLLHQFEDDPQQNKAIKVDITEERATLLFVLDILNKHVIETDHNPVRKTREILDEFSKSLINLEAPNAERLLFRIRQFYQSHRIDEFTYIQKTFDDFKNIIWDFADQLSEDIRFQQLKDREISSSLNDLKEAVEANSIIDLRNKSREFIDFYIEYQTEKETQSEKRLSSIQKNLGAVRKKLTEATHKMQTDHLTGAQNRMSFDEQISNYVRLYPITKTPVTLVTLDIDFFKKINDSYGHDVGDFVIKEFVRLMKETFNRPEDTISRIGGEEFTVILPNYKVEHAVLKVEEFLAKVRKETIVHNNFNVKFTASVGIAQFHEGETHERWTKRADQALYESKRTGRDKYTIAPVRDTLQVA